MLKAHRRFFRLFVINFLHSFRRKLYEQENFYRGLNRSGSHRFADNCLRLDWQKNLAIGDRQNRNDRNRAAVAAAPAERPVTNVEQAQEIYLAPGNPSNATNNILNADNYLLVNNAYALSYNNSRGAANWVAWRITETDFGDAERQNDFRPDPNLPKTFARITPADYTGSGFDRGHLCPSADRSSSPEANSQTFFMTNIIPQTPDLNRNVWNDFETYSRDLVKKNRVDLYVVAGCYGDREN
jgi:endonuclease G